MTLILFERFHYLIVRVFEMIDRVPLDLPYLIERLNRRKQVIVIFEQIHSEKFLSSPYKNKSNLFGRLVQRWQECYSGCDLNNLYNNRQDIKELLKTHPSPEVIK